MLGDYFVLMAKSKESLKSNTTPTKTLIEIEAFPEIVD
jgi:hypothetical protein